MPRRRLNPTGEMPFLEHLEELRWRILWSGLSVAAGTLVGFGIAQYFGILELLIRPVRPFLDGADPVFLNPATPFFVTLKLAIAIGIILAAPVVVYQVWAFFSPALETDEKKVVVPSLYFGLFLFCAGVVLAYVWVLPLALLFLMGFQQEYLESAIEIGEYLGFVTRLLIAFGLAFELPVVIMILSALGLVTPAFLKDKRRHAIVAITVMASLVTPGDLASTFLMMGPLLILYELGIVLSTMIYRRKRARDREERERLSPSSEPPEGAMGVDDR